MVAGQQRHAPVLNNSVVLCQSMIALLTSEHCDSVVGIAGFLILYNVLYLMYLLLRFQSI